jgi:copper transport protein
VRRVSRIGLRSAHTLLAAVGAAVLLAVAPSQAFAHAALLESRPAPGARVEATPPEITMHFTEPLNRGLSKADLVAVPSGKRIAADSRAASAKGLSLRPDRPLRTGAYRVKWHTVSTEDGHALEGSFDFGVRVAAAEGEHAVEQSPLARAGWVRIGLRGLFYAALFFFAGGVLVGAILDRRSRAGDWLVPPSLRPVLSAAGTKPETLTERTAARTLDVGMLALAAAVAVTLEEAADAGGHFSPESVGDFLLTGSAGIARVATVVALGAAVLAARRLRLVAALACVFVFLTIALSGHANSAEQRLPAVLTDWAHLVAGAVWIGGLAQIALAWLPQLRRGGRELGLAVMRTVLERFGRVALPAFIVVAGTGLVNALIQLGRVGALWDSGYGRVLAVKISLVGLIALASYVHALRLRPRLLAANPHPEARRERRHWRLLRAEPLLGVGVVFAAATLVAFPLPPRQLTEADEGAEAASSRSPPCSPCPLPRPRPDELAVAEQAGSSIVAAWLRRTGDGLTGRLRLLGPNQRPVRVRPRVAGARLSPCGPACWRLQLERRPSVLSVRLPERGRLYTARLPAAWQPRASMRARSLVERAQTEMRGLRTVRESETITSGPGTFVATRYRLQAPNRFAYRTSDGARSAVIGTHQWSKAPHSAWGERRFGGGGPGFTTRSWFRWTIYAQSVRLLGSASQGDTRVARLALMDPGTPVWYRLTIDLATHRVVAVRMIADGHFMSQRYHAFNEPLRILAPTPRP